MKNYESMGYSMEPTSIQAEDLQRQRTLTKGTPYKSPFKRDKSPLIEKYQDFTVKRGIVQTGSSNLVQSPSADKSKLIIIKTCREANACREGAYRKGL